MLILLYILDSLRRDFLGCYGDSGAFTPHLDRFAQGATRFTQASAAAPWSKPSGATLFTGQVPRALGMLGLQDRVPTGVPTLAEQLSGQGFQSVVVSANPFISHDFAMLRGFASTVEAFRPGVLATEHFHFHHDHFRRLADSLSVEPEALVLARSPVLHEALLDLLPGDSPSFAVCWSMDTHAPFFVRGEQSLFGNPLDRVIPAADPMWLRDGITVEDMVSLYRDMIAYNDLHFSALVDTLVARGHWDDALVLVTADHGEAFGEHGTMGHTNGLWEEHIAVPLLVKFPGQREASVCDKPVSLVDIAATVRHAASLPEEEGDGVPLQRVVGGETIPRFLLMEHAEGWALRHQEWKVVAQKDTMPLLFNLQTDPHEQRPLGDQQLREEMVRRAEELRAEADRRAARWKAETTELDDPVIARLRALGYL